MITALPAALLLATLPASAAAPQGLCTPDWLPAFGGLAAVDGVVYDSIVFDDGSGPALFVGGAFRTAGGVEALNVARFDGTSWSAAGEGLGSPTLSNYDSVRAFEVFDDGNGPALYAGGDFPMGGASLNRSIARWDGLTWQPLGYVPGDILDMEVFDDGTGPQLYIGGSFATIDGPTLSVGIARYDGTQWSAVDEGVWLGDVTSLIVYDDGSGAGEALYVGGTFTGIRNTNTGGIIDRPGITRWNGSSWSPLGQGLRPPAGSGQAPGYVLSMALHDFGSGEELALGGAITSAGGNPVSHLARWNGSNWADVAGGVSGTGFATVDSLASFDAGSGPALMVSGYFDRAGGAPGFDQLAVLAGGGWVNPGSPSNTEGFPIASLSTFAFGGPPRVLVSGRFQAVGSFYYPWLAAWTGASWESLGTPSMTLSGEARAAVMFDDGSGEKLYVAGAFLGAGGGLHPGVARWNGSGWESAGGGLPSIIVNDLVGMETSQGPRLYAGGRRENGFGSGGPVVLEFDGSSWTPLPDLPGVGSPSGAAVFDLEVYAGPGQPRLYAAGFFGDQFGGSHIARWNGANWSNMQAGVNGPNDPFDSDPGIHSLCVHDDGTGERLYVAGRFSRVASLPPGGNSSNIASFDGLNWHPVEHLVDANDGVVYELEDVELGGVRRLVACGSFQAGSTQRERGLAVLDGAIWSPLPELPAGAGARRHLSAYDVAGTGEQVIVGTLGVGPAQSIDVRLYRLDGAQWLPIGETTNGDVSALEVLEDGTGEGPVLYVCGDFSVAGDEGDAFVARWGGCADRDLGSIYCLSHPNSTGSTAQTSAFGQPTAAANDVTLTATGLPTGSFGYFLTSRSQGFATGSTPGVLCLAGQIGRFAANVQNSGSAGTLSLPIDLTALPQPMGAVSVMAGQTWSFQAWFRDANPLPTSNFSNGLEIQFE